MSLENELENILREVTSCDYEYDEAYHMDNIELAIPKILAIIRREKIKP